MCCGVIVHTVCITMAKHSKYIATCVMIDIYYMLSLNSDGNQFHQYQQNELSPRILTELTEYKRDHDI